MSATTTEPTTRRIVFSGADHNGVTQRGGAGVRSVVAFTQIKFARGYRCLRVWSAISHVEIAGISCDDTGKRTWWAEQ